VYRFLLTPRWVAFHLLVVAGIVAVVNLGFWQLRRLDERQAFNAVVEARYDLDPAPLDSVLDPSAVVSVDGIDTVTAALVADVEWRSVTVTGRYLPGGQIRVVNRSQNGRAGDNLVVPLALDDGRVIYVTRGFVPLGMDDPALPTTEQVTVTGRIRPTSERSGVAARDPAEGVLTEVQRLDLVRLAAQIAGPLVAASLDLIASDPPEAGDLPEPVMRPDLSEGSHLSYAVQWFIFAAAAAAGWVLAVRVSARRRSHASDLGSSRPTAPSAASG
jgi:cytochrome oxidase assembly protein ShyY1